MAISQSDSDQPDTAQSDAAIAGHEAAAGVHRSTLVDLTQLIKTPENSTFSAFGLMSKSSFSLGQLTLSTSAFCGTPDPMAG